MTTYQCSGYVGMSLSVQNTSSGHPTNYCVYEAELGHCPILIEITTNVLVSFRFLCYGSMTIINLLFQCRIDVRIHVRFWRLNPLSPHDALKHHFTSLKTDSISLKIGGFWMKITIKLVYYCMGIFFNLLPSSNHLPSVQVENCDSNSRLVEDKDDNGKFRLERVK